MPAVPIISAIAVGSGAAAALGTAAAGLIGATVTGAAAAAIGSGIIAAGATAIQGGKASDVLKSAVVGGVASFVGGSLASSVSSSVASAAANAGMESIAGAIGRVAGSMAAGGTQAAIRAGVYGGDPIEALLKGGLTAGLTSGAFEAVGSFTSNIPGFDKLDDNYGEVGAAAQRAIKSGLAAGVLGRDVDESITESILDSLTDVVGGELKTTLKDLSGGVRTAYDAATNLGSELDDNIERQNRLAAEYNSTLDALEQQRQTLLADLDRHNAAKARYEETGDTQYLEEANRYAELVNQGSPEYERRVAAVRPQLDALAEQLNSVKAAYSPLEEQFLAQKAVLDTTLAEFQAQEEANAQRVAKVFDEAATAKVTLEDTLGMELGKDQLANLIETGNIAGTTDELLKYLGGETADTRRAVLDALADSPEKAIETARFDGYTPQDFGAPEGETWQTYTAALYNQNLIGQYGENWDMNPDGTRTFTRDDGTSLVVDASGNVLQAYQPSVNRESLGIDYGLGSPKTPLGREEMGGAQGITTPKFTDQEPGDVDYGFWESVWGSGEPGLKMPSTPNLDSMGGGQGLTLPVEGGTVAEGGVYPDGWVSDLGDPNSFINQPAPTGSVTSPGGISLAPPDKPTPPSPPSRQPTGQMPSQLNDANLMALLSLLGGAGGGAQPVAQQAVQIPPPEVESFAEQGYGDIFGTKLQFSSGGSIDELLKLLRG